MPKSLSKTSMTSPLSHFRPLCPPHLRPPPLVDVLVAAVAAAGALRQRGVVQQCADAAPELGVHKLPRALRREGIRDLPLMTFANVIDFYLRRSRQVNDLSFSVGGGGGVIEKRASPPRINKIGQVRASKDMATNVIEVTDLKSEVRHDL